MTALEKAMNVLGEQYKNAFILVEDMDGGLDWRGSEYFGVGACNQFLKNQDDLELGVDLDDDEVED